MPVDMSNYPDNWGEIRSLVLLRSGGHKSDPRTGACCEKCGIENYSVGYRMATGEFICGAGDVFKTYKQAESQREYYRIIMPEINTVVIVLTIAHLDDPNPMNIDLDNLAALCQRCHNVLDMPMRKHNAALTRIEKQKRTGQIEMFEAKATKSGSDG